MKLVFLAAALELGCGPVRRSGPAVLEPGACVADPGTVAPRLPGDQISAEPFEDLTGDGVPGILQTSKFSCGSGGCSYVVYLSQGNCFAPAGVVEGRPTALESSHRGARDLASFWSYGCAKKEGVVHFYEFDGKAYVENKKRNLSCACRQARGSRRPPLCPPLE